MRTSRRRSAVGLLLGAVVAAFLLLPSQPASSAVHTETSLGTTDHLDPAPAHHGSHVVAVRPQIDHSIMRRPSLAASHRDVIALVGLVAVGLLVVFVPRLRAQVVRSEYVPRGPPSFAIAR